MFMLLLICAPILFLKCQRFCQHSDTSPASPNIYLAKFSLTLSISILYLLLFTVSLATSPSILLTFESLGYCLLTALSLLIQRSEYKATGRNSVYLKTFWVELALLEVLTSVLVGVCDGKSYFPIYVVLDVAVSANALFMVFFRERVDQKLLEYEGIWSKFESVTAEKKTKKNKEVKTWNGISSISVMAFSIDEDQTVYFRIYVRKGRDGDDVVEVKRMAVEFNSLYEDYKRVHRRAKMPNFPPRVPQR